MNSSDSSPTSAICQAQATNFPRQQKERKEKQKFFPTNENVAFSKPETRPFQQKRKSERRCANRIPPWHPGSENSVTS